MKLDHAFPIALYDELSKSIESRMFAINPGEIGIISAYGFAVDAERTVAGQFKTPQLACLQQVLFRESDLPGCGSCEGKIVDFAQYPGEILAIDDICLHGCKVTMGNSNNMMLLNVPGAYRFVLNDPSAVGIVRMYVKFVTGDKYPWNSKLFMGEQ